MISVKEKLNFDNLPKHVAIIMDGNGRWAKSQNKERTFGHKNAIKAVREAISACNEVGIPYLTLYTFSTENWNRPTEEVDTLMNLLSSTLLQEAEEIFSKGIRIRAIGDLEALPEVLNAVKELCKKVKNGDINENDIDEKLFEQHLYTKEIPPVDLLIRTSGEVRVSNFLLWQIAYAEMQFIDVLWPDFTKETFFQCILDYQTKERRFGKISEQLENK